MQKKLIALAVAAAFSAPAFADVTAYGVVDAAVVRASADGLKSDTLAYSGGLAQSRIGFKSAEDLDNGMKAVVVLEYGLDTETNQQSTTTPTITETTAVPSGNTYASSGVTASNIAARQQMLAVAGGFGTFATGYLQTTGYDWAVKFDPTSGSSVSPLQNVTKNRFLVGSAAVGARAQRALAYISPAMGDVTVAVNYSTALAGLGNLGVANTAADVKVGATLVSATYNGSSLPLSVGVVYATTNVPSGANATKDMALGASYDLTVVKLMGTYQTTKTDNVDGTNKAMSFTAVAPVGPGAIVATYAKNTIATTATTADNANGLTLAWLQGLSKTTTLYAAYSKMSQDSGTNAYSVIGNALAGGTAGGSSTLLALGLKKTF